jgi:phosphatidylethanolamine/phosphatidyl-N-methylethanolamine N-methyltransferase
LSPVSHVNRAKLLKEFLQKPLATGTIVPSSSHLAKLMVRCAGVGDADVVLEYGAGTGAITGYILRELSPRSKFAAIEINRQLAAVFRESHPGVPVFEDSVENVRAICDSMNVAMVDCIISGLPWALFSKSMQVRILDTR